MDYIFGIFTIKFNGNGYDEILELKKKKFSYRPTHIGETGSGKGKQNYFYSWPGHWSS